MKRPKFSIIIPVYNTEKYLEKCIKSTLAFNYDNYEVIIIDDGSTDSSVKIIDYYSSSDKRVIVHHKVNGGQSSARNIGLSLAKGDYILFLDSDDWYCNGELLNDLATIILNQESPDVIIFPYIRYINSKKTNIYGQLRKKPIENMAPEQIISLLVQEDCFFCSPCTKTIKRKILTEKPIDFDEQLSCEDIDWYYRVLGAVKSIAYYDTPSMCYRKRSGSVSTSFSRDHFMDFFDTIKKYAALFSDTESRDYKKGLLSSVAKHYCNALIIYSRNQNELLEFKHILKKYAWLFRYNLNPRTRKIGLAYHLLGFNGMIKCLTIIDKKQDNE